MRTVYQFIIPGISANHRSSLFWGWDFVETVVASGTLAHIHERSFRSLPVSAGKRLIYAPQQAPENMRHIASK